MFCPKCKSILGVVKVDGESVFKCDPCEEIIKIGSNVRITQKLKPSDEIRVADEKDILAVHNHICAKCGHNKAQMIERGIWYSDEAASVVYKCGKCGSTEKVDEKVK